MSRLGDPLEALEFLMCRAVLGAKPNKALVAVLVRLRALSSSTCPNSTKVTITVAASK